MEVPPGGAALVRRVREHPAEPLVATILGPGGTGKTLLLDALAQQYAEAGERVVRVTAATSLSIGAVLLVDDAHRLTPDRLAELHASAHTDGARVVLAYRPWPRPDGLAEFSAGVGARRVVALVRHLDRPAVAERIVARLGGPAPEAMAEFVHDESGGLPALVDLVTDGLVDSGRVGTERFAAPERVTVSAALAERLRHRVDALPAPVQDLLTVLAHGAPLDGDVLAQLLAPGTELDTAVEAARATGLLTESGVVIPLIGTLFLRLTPVLRGRDLHRRLATIEIGRGGPVLATGRRLLSAGASGRDVADVLVAAADEAVAGSPALAAELLAAAVDAGHPRLAVAGRRAHALALAGELDRALALADDVLARPDAPDRDAAVVAAASALAHRGLPARATELLCTLPASGPAAIAVPGLVAAGRIDDARTVLDAATDPGSLRDGAARLLGAGMIGSVTGSGAALSQLAQAAAMLEPVGATGLLPDSPAALTSIVALLSGQPGIAESTLRRAIEGRHGGRVTMLRHRLLLGRVLLARGVTGSPTGLLERLRRQDGPVEPRDALVAAALEVALARRREDPAAMAASWPSALDALVRHPVDLTSIPVLGELAVAAAQLGEEHWLAGPLDDIDAILDRLGRPVLWTASLTWYRLQAAVVAGRPDDVHRLAAALPGTSQPETSQPETSQPGTSHPGTSHPGTSHPGTSQCGTVPPPYAGVLAAAARCWTAVFDGDVDVQDVVTVGRRMGGMGLGHEAAQLAGRAAAVVGDRRSSQALHAFARSLGAAPAAPVAPEQAVPTAPRPEMGALTERELEIGRHILDGLTYRQIGERLFISAKTVEHYVARMRQRLGVATRNEMFALLHAALGTGTPGAMRSEAEGHSERNVDRAHGRRR